MVVPAANKPYEVEFLELLEQELPKEEKSIWLDGVRLEISAERAAVIAPTMPQLEVLRSRWEQPIREIISRLVDGEIEVVFESQQLAGPSPSDAPASSNAGTGAPTIAKGFDINLRPNFNFDSFITGPSNKLAHAASLSVAENPGSAYNPFFIHGSVGLGKTHLLHAIAHRLLEQGYQNIIVASCASFTNEFIAALTSQNIDRFRKRYRSADVLLIDDIQFLSEKERTQEEFFHTFNEIYNREQQLVLYFRRASQGD